MLIKLDTKWVWVDKDKSPELQEKIDQHLNYLKLCKIEDSKIFGDAFVVSDLPKYWQQ